MFSSRLRTLLGLMPGRTADKTSVTTITTPTPVVATKVVVVISIVTSIGWRSVGHVIVIVITMFVVLLLSVPVVSVVACTASCKANLPPHE